MNKNKKGWGFPINSKKAHYFDGDSMSLCNRWMFLGELEDDNHDSPDNCASCKTKLTKKYGINTVNPAEPRCPTCEGKLKNVLVNRYDDELGEIEYSYARCQRCKWNDHDAVRDVFFGDADQSVFSD